MALNNETKARIGSRMMRAKSHAENEWAQAYWQDVGALIGEPPVPLTVAEDADVMRINAIRDALEAAEDEGVHVYRGTDEPRPFAAILRKAIRGHE